MHDQTRPEPKYKSAFDCAQKIMGKEGYGGFYNGYRTFLYRNSPIFFLMTARVLAGQFSFDEEED